MQYHRSPLFFRLHCVYPVFFVLFRTGTVMLSFISFLILFGSGTLAATVSKKLTIGNAELSPDGFKRT